MIYRKYTIETQYLPGADFTVDNNGKVKDRKPTIKDVDYYSITAPCGARLVNELTLTESKQSIDRCIS